MKDVHKQQLLPLQTELQKSPHATTLQIWPQAPYLTSVEQK